MKVMDVPERARLLAERVSGNAESADIVRGFLERRRLMYEPAPETRPEVDIPGRYYPQPNLGDWEYPVSTGMMQGYPIPVSYGAPVSVEAPASVSALDPVKDAARRIMAVENSKGNPDGGWNAKEGRWYPHGSVEGGADTIAYGIKLSNGTPEAKLALKQGYLTDEQAEHFVDTLAQRYYDAAKGVYDGKYGAGEWDKLSDKSQSILVDYSYNPGLAKFPKLMEGFHSGDMDLIRQNYKRYVNGRELGRNKTLLEEIDTLGNEYPIFRGDGGLMYGDGGLKEKLVGAVEKIAGNEKNIRRMAKFAEKHPKTVAKASRAVRDIIPEDKLFSVAVLAHNNAWNSTPIERIAKEYGEKGGVSTESPTGYIYGEWADPGNSYLLSPDSQKKYMERLGYHALEPDSISDSDYGLVKTAAINLGNKIGRKIPIYQIGNDYITRDKLVPIYNGQNTLIGDSGNGVENPVFYNHIVQYDDDYREKGTLSHAGSYPFAVYSIPGTNEYVYKAWDLNDYGNHGTSGGVSYGADRTIDSQDHQYLANLYDILGEPFVQTTGYTLIPSFTGKRLPTEDEYNKVYDKISGQEKYTTDRSKGSYYISENDMKRDILTETAKELLKQGYLPFIGNVKASGGGIHIAPSKRGTFTAAAKKHGKSVQAFASQVLANKNRYSSAMVKKANFARNAARWHAEGGILERYDVDSIRQAIQNARERQKK